LEFDESTLEMVKDTNRVDIKEKVRKDYESMFRLVLWKLHMGWYNVDYFVSQIENIYNQISELHLEQLVENP
jgi:hypothetical protein